VAVSPPVGGITAVGSAVGGKVLSAAGYVAVAAGAPQADKSMIVRIMREVIFFISVSFHFILYQVPLPSPLSRQYEQQERRSKGERQDLLWIDRFGLRVDGNQELRDRGLIFRILKHASYTACVAMSLVLQHTIEC
jgi:hypothetical protein